MPARVVREKTVKTSKMHRTAQASPVCCRFFGGIFQPVLGTANYLLGPTKPNYKPVLLPTGAPHLYGSVLSAAPLGGHHTESYRKRFLGTGNTRTVGIDMRWRCRILASAAHFAEGS